MPSTPPVYPPGSIKKHPEWPTEKFLAVRTIFDDADATACTSWLRISPSVGVTYVTSAAVADWPDVPFDPTV
jgi:hypothetical protein